MKCLLILLSLALLSTVYSDACAGNPCGVGTCVAKGSYKRCLCPQGYFETSTGTCADVDECQQGKTPCGENSHCNNTIGGYECSCWKAYYWDGYDCIRKGKGGRDRSNSDGNDNPSCPGSEFPSFLVKPEESVTLELGDTLKLECVAAGSPAPYVYWVKGIKRERLGPMAVGRSTFYLPEVKKRDIDLYECVIEDCCSGRIARAKVDVSVPSAPCADEKIKMYGTVWEFKTWDNALAFCESKGYTLGVIQTAEERKIMRKDAWRAYQVDPNAKKFANQFWMWIGVTDRDEENKFRTLEGGKVEPRWYPGTPDNWEKLDPQGQDVVAVNRLSGYWDDSYAFFKRPFACQCPADRAAGAK